MLIPLSTFWAACLRLNARKPGSCNLIVAEPLRLNAFLVGTFGCFGLRLEPVGRSGRVLLREPACGAWTPRHCSDNACCMWHVCFTVNSQFQYLELTLMAGMIMHRIGS
jgi:hypothetical protein